jgi:hypothetical protein
MGRRIVWRERERCFVVRYRFDTFAAADRTAKLDPQPPIRKVRRKRITDRLSPNEVLLLGVGIFDVIKVIGTDLNPRARSRSLTPPESDWACCRPCAPRSCPVAERILRSAGHMPLPNLDRDVAPD